MKICSLLLAFFSLFLFAYCDENKKEDPCNISKPDPIWFENHLWKPVVLEHCYDCPCGNHYDFSEIDD